MSLSIVYRFRPISIYYCNLCCLLSIRTECNAIRVSCLVLSPSFFSFYSFGMHHRTVARDAPEAACGCLICRAKTLGCARTELLIPEMELGPGHLLEANTYSTGRPSRMQHLATAISIVRRQNWGQAIEHVSLSTQVGRCQMDASTPIRR